MVRYAKDCEGSQWCTEWAAAGNIVRSGQQRAKVVGRQERYGSTKWKAVDSGMRSGLRREALRIMEIGENGGVVRRGKDSWSAERAAEGKGTRSRLWWLCDLRHY